MARMSRRALLAGIAATLACGPSRAQTGGGATEVEPLVLRPSLAVADPRYVNYATVGDFAVSTNPTSVSLKSGKVLVLHPKLAKRGRLVVFSHHLLADPLSYRNLLYQWATHGFVVVAPVHRDAVTEQGGGLRTSVSGQVSEWQMAEFSKDDAALRARVAQISGVIDGASDIARTIGMEIDVGRPVVAGHGIGAFGAQLVLGADVSAARPGLAGLADPRFFSGILMSPQGPGAMGLTETSWERVASPLLVVVAEGDRDLNGQTASQKWAPYALSRPGYKHLGVLKGGGPNTFVGQASGPEAALLEVIKAQTTAFLEAYGNYDRTAYADVSSGFFQRMSLGLVSESRR